MTVSIKRIVGDDHAPGFKSVRIRTIEKLLDRAAEPKGRAALAEQVGLPTATILDFVNVADLMRVKGLGSDYIRLLRLAGVATVRDLRHRNPTNLWQEMVSTNTAQTTVSVLPSINFVTRWIEQAKLLPLKVTYR